MEFFYFNFHFHFNLDISFAMHAMLTNFENNVPEMVQSQQVRGVCSKSFAGRGNLKKHHKIFHSKHSSKQTFLNSNIRLFGFWSIKLCIEHTFHAYAECSL